MPFQKGHTINVGCIRGPQSEETKQKIRNALKGRYIPNSGQFQKGHKVLDGWEKGAFQKGHKTWSKGLTKYTNSVLKKLSEDRSGEKNWNWKGDKVGYLALHDWVRNTLGNPIKCSNGHITERHVWANISGEYKREKSDWHELCMSCNATDGIKKADRFS